MSITEIHDRFWCELMIWFGMSLKRFLIMLNAKQEQISVKTFINFLAPLTKLRHIEVV
jgi:hypothetical protein